MKKYLFLDFDGVLFDTLKEAYIICRYTYRKTDYFEPVDEKEYKLFNKYKFLVYNSWQYYYLMNLIDKNLSDTEFIKQYNYFLNNRNLKEEENFDKIYYLTRADLINNHNNFWNDLEIPFEFCNYIKQNIHNYNCVIVSKKNKSAIKYRLNQHHINLHTNNIFGKDELERFETKAQFITKYMKNNNIKTAYFIDDNSNNLVPCKDYPHIKPLLAGWGNIAINEIGYSNAEIIQIISK